MGIGAVVAIGTAISAASQVHGAVQARRQAKRRSRLMEEEGAKLAKRKKIELRKLKALQRVAFAKSGVSLEGSPLEVLLRTEKEGAQEVTETREQAQFASKEEQRAGRSRFVGGLGQAGGTVAGGFAKTRVRRDGSVV